MRAPLVALLLLLPACTVTPQWDACTLEGCSEDPEGDRAACLSECENRPEPAECRACSPTDPAACAACEAYTARSCVLECHVPACSGTCPEDYACLGTGEGRFCRQRCETAADCTDPATAADGETVCAGGCGVSCNPFRNDADCPPETRCVGEGSVGRCLP